MTYALEALGADRFQRLCQALLVREFQNVQCFPLGQADGGRDATVPISDADRSFVVYQVKFTRDALSVDDPHKWVLSTLEDEKDKLKRLVRKGAKRYVVLTNVRGTGSLDKGSIDKADALLSEALALPTSCWWRDDIERRLDLSWELKWAYPDVLSGPDLIRYFIEKRLNEHESRRSNAVRTFLADQYAAEREVRFRQVELQNDLFSLYVDIPIAPVEGHAQQQKSPRHLRSFENFRGRLRAQKSAARPSTGSSSVSERNEIAVGAAALFLDDEFASSAPRIVLEGAPGQGKSTVTQYVCQIHRMRLLGNTEVNPQLPTEHVAVPLRLPIRVDLRDFAVWLQQRDPFATDVHVPPAEWHKSLEAFLAALVRHHSGGSEFSVSDLQAVLSLTPVFLALDGLDEVADITRRFEVVEEIQRGIGRLSAIAASMQVVVTSRPAAFANSPGLPDNRFPTFHLTFLSRPVIEAYAEKWLDARRLVGKPRADVNRILRSKLDQPHLRDLAKNPMQLTILLSLIHTKGASLPDKRTALYDAYVDLFFSREAEKSDIVRENRDLLLDIHRYLAFVLHRDSELGGKGSINTDELQATLRNYLVQEGYDGTLSQALFRGMVERVVALVSRVEGTYEFEVQPLREYFAARFLADTAPLSPAGDEQRGTKPDRFDAVSHNFYWQNVTRFYAGCFGKGELLALSDRVVHLTKSGDFSLISYPRILAATLLSDWVFSQSPRAVQEIATLIFGPAAIRFLLAPFANRRSGHSIVLADGCGRKELVESCVELLSKGQPRDFAYAVEDLLEANSSTAELVPLWEKEASSAATPELRRELLRQSQSMSILQRWPRESLERTYAGELTTPQVLQALLRAGRYDVLHRDAGASEALLHAVMNRDVHVMVPANRDRLSPTEALTMLHQPRMFSMALHRPNLSTLHEFWRTHRGGDPLTTDQSLETNNPMRDRIAQFCTDIQPALTRSTAEWAGSIEPWERMVEASRSEFGDHWAQFEIAALSASAYPRESEEQYQLCDGSLSLCRRAGHAATMSKRGAWWQAQLKNCSDTFDLPFWLLMLVQVGSAGLLLQFIDDINRVSSALNDVMWRRLEASIRRTGGRQFRKVEMVDRLPVNLSSRAAVVLAYCFKYEGKLRIYRRFLSTYAGSDPTVWDFCLSIGFRGLVESSKHDEPLQIIRRAYRSAPVAAIGSVIGPTRHGSVAFSVETAQQIARDPEGYPLTLLERADEILRGTIAKQVEPVAHVAERESWLTPPRPSGM